MTEDRVRARTWADQEVDVTHVTECGPTGDSPTGSHSSGTASGGDAWFLDSSLRTNRAVGGLIFVWLLQTLDPGLFLGFASGLLLSDLLFVLTRRAVESLTGPDRPGTLQVLLLFVGKLLLALSYLIFFIRRCSVSPVTFCGGFSSIFFIMALKALLALNRAGLEDRGFGKSGGSTGGNHVGRA